MATTTTTTPTTLEPDAFARARENYAEHGPREDNRVAVRRGGYLGFVRLTWGGFWRAWRAYGIGCGPFASSEDAIAWVADGDDALRRGVRP